MGALRILTSAQVDLDTFKQYYSSRDWNILSHNPQDLLEALGAMSEPIIANSKTYHATAAQEVEDFLCGHLPYSLPLLRRIQFHSHSPEAIVACSHVMEPSEVPAAYAYGYLDPRVSGVQLWLFTSLDRPTRAEETSRDRARMIRMTLTCLRAVLATIKQRFPDKAEDVIFIGSVHGNLADAMRRDDFFSLCVRDDVFGPGGPYDKLLLRNREDLAAVDCSLPKGYFWDEVGERDYELVMRNNSLVRRSDFAGRASIAIKDWATTEVKAFAFIGHDGSTRTLHVEPDVRNRGFGKMLAARITRETWPFPNIDDDWAHTDVARGNEASTALFRGLGFRDVAWDCYWMRVELGRM